MLDAIGVEPVEVRLPAHLDGLSGLCLPGGESTTMRRLIDRWALREPLLEFAATGAPLFGTCAGMIILSKEIADGDEPVLPLLDVTVRRNAFGRQLDSFEGELQRADRGRPAGPRRVHPRPGHRARRVRASTCWRRSTTAGSWRSASGTSSRRRSTRSSPASRASTGSIATMAAEHDDPGEGSGRRRHPTRRARAAAMSSRADRRPPGQADRQGPRRAPDRPAGARRAVADRADRGLRARARSACPSTGRRSACSACSGCRSSRSGRTTCCSSTSPTGTWPGSSAWSARAGATTGRSSSSMRSGRDAAGRAPRPGEIRFRLVQQILREGQKRGASRFHVACADADDNVELFMQAGLRALRRGARAVPPARPAAAAAVDRRARREGADPPGATRSTPTR